MYPAQHLDDDELQSMIDEVDADGSGVIEFDEFVHMIVLRMERAMMEDEQQVKKGLCRRLASSRFCTCAILEMGLNLPR